MNDLNLNNLSDVFAKMGMFAVQFQCHAMLLIVAFGAPEYLPLSFLVYFITGCFGMTMTYHRGLAHRSWQMPKWWEYFGTLCGAYGAVGSSMAWVATHRKHHKFSDKPEDPHSPSHMGFWKVQFLSMLEPVELSYSKDLVKDKFHKFVHEYYLPMHMVVIAFWLIVWGPLGVAVMWGAPAAILWNAGSFVNSLNHMDGAGYRNHSTKDLSRNHWFTGWFTWGEGWHNNHHNAPSNSQFQEKWWEVDIGGYFIRLVNGR